MADVSITASAVAKSASGQTQTYTAGATITQGQACYIDASNLAKLADANSGAAGDLIRTVSGIALNAASSGQPVTLVTSDSALNLGATLTSGDDLYLSVTAGGITATKADVTSGATTVHLGQVLTGGATVNFSVLIGGVKA